jgi:cytochrome c
MNQFFKTTLTGIALSSLFIMSILIVGCSSKPETQAEKEARWTRGELSSFEFENGIGPITKNLNLNAPDTILAKQGKAVFVQKCASCHYLDMRKTGPALRDVSKRRSGAYIMNQILNPDLMGKLHPEGKKLVAQYAQYMTIQGVTPDMARQLLEFLRTESDKTALPMEQQPGFDVSQTAVPVSNK